MTTSSADRSRPRAARQRLSEEERRTQILRATVLVVSGRGFDGASASRIAERAGVSKGLIWRYFADKADLMRQAMDATLKAITAEVVERFDLSAPAPDIVRANVRAVASLSKTHPDELRALHEIARNLPAPGDAMTFVPDYYEQLHKGQEMLFRKGQEEGTFREFDTRVMAVTYQSALDTMLDYFDSHPDTDIEQYADALTDILLNAMKRR